MELCASLKKLNIKNKFCSFIIVFLFPFFLCKIHKSQLSENIWCALCQICFCAEYFIFVAVWTAVCLYEFLKRNEFAYITIIELKGSRLLQSLILIDKHFVQWLLVLGRWALTLEIEPLFYWLGKAALEMQLPCLHRFSPLTLEWWDRWTNRSTGGWGFSNTVNYSFKPSYSP